MAENKPPFAEGASIHRPPMFCGFSYQFLLNLLIVVFGMLLLMDRMFLKCWLIMCLLINLGVIGLVMKVGKLSMIALLKI